MIAQTFRLLDNADLINQILERAQDEILEATGLQVKLEVQGMGVKMVIDAVAQLIAGQLGLPMKDLLSKSRLSELVDARAIVMELCYRHIGDLSLKQIADYFCYDHTSIIHGINKVDNMLQTQDPLFVPKYEKCKNILIQKMQ